MKSDYNLTAFGKRLQEVREESGITQAELAERLGVTQVSLSRYETGERQASINFLMDFAAFFDISTDYLLGLSHVKSKQGDIQAACHAVGLSDKGVQELHAFISNSSDDSEVLQSPVIADRDMGKIQFRKSLRIRLFENTAFYELLSGIARLSDSTLLFAKILADRDTAKKLDASKIYELLFSELFLPSISQDTAEKDEAVTNMALSILKGEKENTAEELKKTLLKIMKS